MCATLAQLKEPIMDGEAQQTGKHSPIPEMLESAHVLRDAVKRMFRLYDENDLCNELQPDSLRECYPHSLDDWLVYLDRACDDLNTIAGFYGALEAKGFSPEVAGGGCIILSTYRGNCYVWATCEGGGRYPQPDSWHIGVYVPDSEHEGDAIWQMTSEEGESAPKSIARCLSVVDAAIATIELAANMEETIAAAP